MFRKFFVRSGRIFILFAIMLAAASAQAANTWYVAPTGSDLNNGSSAAPFRTIQRAINGAAAGDTISVAAGTYTKSLTWSRDLVIQGAGAGQSIIDPSATGGTGGRCLTTTGLSSASRLEGITLQNGSVPAYPQTGGGMSNTNSSLTIINCAFNGNTGYNGGGIYNSGGSPIVTNCTFSGNNSTNWASAIFNYYSNPTVTGCFFTGNSGNGGGAMYNNHSAASVADCTFNGNSGGAMDNNFSDATVTGCIFSGNTGSGAMINDDSAVAVTNCTFSNNTGHVGGGMYFASQGSLNGVPTVTNCTFSGNNAVSGGAIYASDNCNPIVANCTFISNSASSRGGAILNEPDSPIIINCTFRGNTAYLGGAIYNNRICSPTITNCTFTGNSAAYLGGVMYNYGSTPTVTNCILWGNSAWGSTWIYNYLGGSTVISHSDVQDMYSSSPDQDGNFSADPLFVGCHSLALQLGSPCLNAGDNIAVQNSQFPVINGVIVDLEGNARIQNGTVDLGAYEGIQVSTNHGPTANAGTAQNVKAAHSGDPVNDTASVTLDGSGSSDQDGDTLTFSWDDHQGHTSSNSNPQFSLPVGAYDFALTVTDPCGLYDTSSVTVTVGLADNQYPIASGSSNSPVTVVHDHDPNTNTATIALDGSASIDPNNDSLTFQWTEGQSSLGASSTLQLSRPAGDYKFTLTVTDKYGAMNSTDVLVHVNAEPNAKPAASAYSNSPVSIAHDGNPATNTATISLNGSASSDPDNDNLTFQWKLNNSVVSTSASFNTDKTAGTYTFTLTVTDPYGATDSKDVVVQVIAEPNSPPTLTVPATAAVNIGCPVTIKATAVDPDDAQNALAFSRASGPSWATVSAGGDVVLNPPAGTVGTFTVGVKVTDPYGATDQKNVTVTVCPMVIESVTLSKKNGVTTVQFNLRNTDGTIVNTVSLNSSTLKGIATMTAMPITFTQLKQGVVKTVQLKFNNVPSGQAQFIVNGTSSSGPVNAIMTVNVP